MDEQRDSLDKEVDDWLAVTEHYRLPQNGDRFFVSSPSGVPIDRWLTRMIFDKPGDPNFLLYKDYAFAYEAAVRALCSEVEKGKEERLIFPILMCLHQHFELALKLILHWIRAEFKEDKDHGLLEIWTAILKERHDLAWGPPGTDTSVSDLLAEFDRVTATGFGGRYPFSVKRGLNYLEDIQTIDLRNLQCRAENLTNYFVHILLLLERENGLL